MEKINVAKHISDKNKWYKSGRFEILKITIDQLSMCRYSMSMLASEWLSKQAITSRIAITKETFNSINFVLTIRLLSNVFMEFFI